jgi:hypothetical protein
MGPTVLCQLPYFKTFLGVSGTSEDARLSLLLTQADNWVKEYCGQAFERARYREYCTGNNRFALVLRRRPVKTVYQVKLDFDGRAGQFAGGFDSTSVLAEGVDYYLDRDSSLGVDGQGNPLGWSKSGILYRVGTAWPQIFKVAQTGKLSPEMGADWGNVFVDYDAGYDATKDDGHPEAVPAALRDAVCLLAACRRRSGPYGAPITREKLGRWEVDTEHTRYPGQVPGVPNEVVAMIAPFREWSV